MEFEKIRTIRKSQKITLAQLAERTGLSTSYLSQVERGKVDCSISSLRKIASELGVHPVNFFDKSESQKTIVRKSERQLFGKKGQGILYELLTPDTRRRMQITLVEFPPNYKDKTAGMKHDKEEWIFVLKNKIIIHMGKNEYGLEEGDSIYFTCVPGYGIENPTNEETIVIGAISPPIL